MPVAWTDIVKELDNIDTQLSLMKGANSAKKCKELGEKIFEITQHMRKLGEDGQVIVGSPPPDTATRAMVTREIAGPSAAKPSTSNIEAFFQAIGDGVRAAQVNLDLQSAAYMQNKHPFAPETMFRLPKVSANLRLGMRIEEKEGTNIFLFESTEGKTQFSEQEISFEIAAVHPPPDALAATAGLPLGSVIASSIEDRDRAHERLTSEKARQLDIAKKAEKDSKEEKRARLFAAGANILLEPANFRHVLVLHGQDKLILVKVPAETDRRPDNPDVGVIILSMPMEAGTDGPVESTLIKASSARSKPLFDALARVADLQASLLASLDRR